MVMAPAAPAAPECASLDFVIVGGSVAGLASAFALRRAGHNCVVLEAQEGPRKGLGPIRSPPNMTRLLERWGMLADVRSRGSVGTALVFRDGDTAEVVGVQKLIGAAMEVFGADFIVCQHANLYEILSAHARAAGVEIRSGARVVAVDAAAPAVLLASGERVAGDIVVGADGTTSVVRECLIKLAPQPSFEVRHIYVFSLPLDDIKADPALTGLTDNVDWHIYMGNDVSLHVQPTDSKLLLVIRAASVTAAPPAHASWDTTVPLDVSSLNLDGLGPQPRKLIGLAKEAVCVRDFVYPPLEEVVHEDHKVVLVGDAAHPIIPCGTQAVPLAIEDAAALGALFARCRSRADVPGLLSAFGDVRQPRGEAMLASEREKLAFLTLPRGPAQAARDAGFRAAMAAAVQLEDVEDEAIAREAEDFVRQWAYDAYEAVDDWWTQWGAIRFPPDGEDTRTRVFWNTQVEST